MGWGTGPLGEGSMQITLRVRKEEHAQHKEFVRLLHESGRRYRHWLMCAERVALRELRKREKDSV